MQENLIVDFVGQIADKNVVVVRGVFFARGVGLIGPINPDFLLLISSGTGRKDEKTCLSMDMSAVESCHGALGHIRIVKFNESVVEAFGLELFKSAKNPSQSNMSFCKAGTPRAIAYRCWTGSRNILVRNNLDALDMARGFENLLQHFLRDSRIQSANVQGSLVGLWRCTAHKASSAIGRHHLLSVHRGAQGCRYRIGVLGNAQGWRWHV